MEWFRNFVRLSKLNKNRCLSHICIFFCSIPKNRHIRPCACGTIFIFQDHRNPKNVNLFLKIYKYLSFTSENNRQIQNSHLKIVTIFSWPTSSELQNVLTNHMCLLPVSLLTNEHWAACFKSNWPITCVTFLSWPISSELKNVLTNQVRERSSGGVQYEESGLPSPDLLVEGLEPGAAYIATITSSNKKVSQRLYQILTKHATRLCYRMGS